MLKNLITLLIIFYSNLYLTQTNVSSDVKRIYDQETVNTEQALINSKKMLEISKTPEDSILSYLAIGDLKDKQLEYYIAIDNYHKAAKISLRLNDYNNVVKANTLLALTYWNTGLMSKYKLAWNEAEKFSKQASNFESFANQHKMWILEKEEKYCKAIPYAENNVSLILKNADFTKKENKIHLAAFICGSAYYFLKCNTDETFKKGRAKIAEVEDLISKSTTFEAFYYSQKYYLCKAIIAHHDNDKKNTLFWFKKALDISIYQKNYRTMSLIMDEGEKLSIKSSELQYANEFINLLHKKTKEIARISDEEIIDKESEIYEEKKNSELILICTSLAVLLSCGVIAYYIISKRKAKKRFLEIISNLKVENSKNDFESTDDKDSINLSDYKTKITTTSVTDSKKIMSDEKEAELVKKLNAFEKGKEYRDNSFTISSMASLFETNTRYLNFIISSHRQMNFNDYINHLRIKHLVGKLYNDPNFLNYKISYLSEYSGFSSHSRFAHIFKKELGISPSDFINNLKKERS